MKRLYLLVILIIAFGTGFVITQADEYFEIMRSIELFGSTYKEIVTNYVEDVSAKNLMKRGIDGMLEALDPFSNFFDETEKGELDLLTTGKYGGIGILIDSRGGELIVMEVMPGYAAQRQGIKVGDVILSIDDETVTPQNINKLIYKVRGQPGTEVKLKIKRPGENKVLEFHLVREEIKVESISIADFVPEEDGIFYAKIDRFSKRVTEEFFKKLNEEQKNSKVNAIIIDLRSNPGGLLQSAIELLEFFIPKGEMMLYTMGRSEESRQEFFSKITPKFGDIPLAILIDENSASASEIVAGTIQDLDRGIIVGAKSFGKGLVQTVIPLPYEASLKLTTARYYTPTGRCIQKNDYLRLNQDILKSRMDSNKVFYTKNKRIVYGDGGITPDTIIRHNGKPEIIKELLNKGMFFKYASERTSIKENFDPHNIDTDEMINDFLRFLQKENFQYEPSYEKTFNELLSQLESNGTQKSLLDELNRIKNRMPFDYKNEVLFHKADVYKFLLAEFINQIKNSKFQLSYLKKYDEDVQTAINLLKDKKLYKKMLGMK